MKRPHAQSTMADRWDRSHMPSNSQVPSNLFTDENPATTIKGTGFKNRRTAVRTIELTSQPGVRYKQFWTIKAMRERAQHHPHQTAEMVEAIAEFDEWLSAYTEPSQVERETQALEWERHHTLCAGLANAHRYEGDDKQAIKRARQDIKQGAACLLRSVASTKPLAFPLAAFTAVFGGPGTHGYGSHVLNGNISQIVIESAEEYEAIVGKAKLPVAPKRVSVRYDRATETASVEVVHAAKHRTIDSMFVRKGPVGGDGLVAPGEDKVPVVARSATDAATAAAGCVPWVCSVCTLEHCDVEQRDFLSCSMCGAERYQNRKGAPLH